MGGEAVYCRALHGRGDVGVQAPLAHASEIWPLAWVKHLGQRPFPCTSLGLRCARDLDVVFQRPDNPELSACGSCRISTGYASRFVCAMRRCGAAGQDEWAEPPDAVFGIDFPIRKDEDILSNMESSGIPRNSPAEDLALVGQAQAHLETPRRFAIAYDVLYSIACGGLVAAQALPSMIRPFATIIVILAMIGLMTWWRHRLGWWLSGYSPRRARWAAFEMIVPLVALMMWVWMVPDLWVAITGGTVGAAVAFGASRLWARMWRQERRSSRDLA